MTTFSQPRPKKFGRYVVEEEIGDGAMGRVYRCSDPLMKRLVAVKTVKQEYLTRETAEEYLRRFRREAQAAGRLSHPNIVGIYDVGETYFVMEYLEGRTLQALLARARQAAPRRGPRPLRAPRRRPRLRAPLRRSSTATSSPRTSWSWRTAARS